MPVLADTTAGVRTAPLRTSRAGPPTPATCLISTTGPLLAPPTLPKRPARPLATLEPSTATAPPVLWANTPCPNAPLAVAYTPMPLALVDSARTPIGPLPWTPAAWVPAVVPLTPSAVLLVPSTPGPLVLVPATPVPLVLLPTAP